MKYTIGLLLLMTTLLLAQSNSLHQEYQSLYKAIDLFGSARIAGDNSYWAASEGSFYLTRDNSGSSLCIEVLEAGFTIKYNTSETDSLDVTLFTPSWQEKGSDLAFEEYCKTEKVRANDSSVLKKVSLEYFNRVCETFRKRVKENIEAECKKGKEALIDQALQRVSKLNNGYIAAAIKANLHSFDKVVVEYTDDEIRVTIDNRCCYVPMNCEVLRGITVYLIEGSIQYNQEGNLVGAQNESLIEELFSSLSPQRLALPTPESKRVVAKIFPDGTPSGEILILEHSDYYKVTVRDHYGVGFFSVDKNNWKRFDRRHKHYDIKSNGGYQENPWKEL